MVFFYTNPGNRIVDIIWKNYGTTPGTMVYVRTAQDDDDDEDDEN